MMSFPSSIDAEQVDPALLEQDYCTNAAARFREHWAQHGTFQPAALQHYGVLGESTLMRSLMQRKSFAADFTTVLLGDLRDFNSSPAPQPGHLDGSDGFAPRGLNGNYDVPMGAVLLGPQADPRVQQQCGAPQLQAMQKELGHAWAALSQPSEWCSGVVGVVTTANWVTVEQRRRAEEQVQLAAFMGVKAIQVPLPLLRGGCFQENEEDTAWETAGGQEDGVGVSTEEYAQRNWQLLSAVADTLLAYIQHSDNRARVWVRCDACYPLQRRQFHALRSLILYGKEVDPMTGLVVGPRTVRAQAACEDTRREAINAIAPVLYFSNAYVCTTFSSEWLGEDVAAFDVPPADVMLQILCRNLTAGHHHQQRQQGQGGAEDNAMELSGSCAGGYDYGEGLASGSDGEVGEMNSLLAMESQAGSLGAAADATAPLGSGLPSPQQGAENGSGGQRELLSMSTGLLSPEEDKTGPQEHSHFWKLPDDLRSQTQSRWAGGYPATVSLLTLVVELLRRRAVPMFSTLFFDHYAIMNYLYSAAVLDSARDGFAPFEDRLQLPLQPLGHQLSSNVYEVFECDARKYKRYRDAFYAYALDWINADAATHHHGIRCSSFVAAADASGQVPFSGNATETMYVVLLGCGRGPLIDEILSAASSLGIRVRLFALEKNAPAAAFTELRWRCDPEWQHLSSAFGHTLTTIVTDGRRIHDRRAELSIPADFGLCDVVVSELLGSFGDNELSPECIEGFLEQLGRFQKDKEGDGLAANPYLVSIPESYTSWLAPLHSVHLEQAVAEAAVSGLTVRPEGCTDRHAALFHSIFVCNITRGHVLCPPQPCWTFVHGPTASPPPVAVPRASSGGSRRSGAPATTATGGASGAAAAALPATFERRASLTFTVPDMGRCSGFAGFFSAVLYQPRRVTGEVVSPVTIDEGHASRAITLATAPIVSIRGRVDGRTPGMYSWFPCYLPLEPGAVRDFPARDSFLAEAATGNAVGPGQGNSKSAATAKVRVDITRNVDDQQRKVWYEWRASVGEEAAWKVAETYNEKGWASPVLL